MCPLDRRPCHRRGRSQWVAIPFRHVARAGTRSRTQTSECPARPLRVRRAIALRRAFRKAEVLPHLAVEGGTDPPTCDKLHRLRDAHGPGSTDRRQIAEDVPQFEQRTSAGGTQVRNVTDGLPTQDVQGWQCLCEHVIKAPCSRDRQTAWQADPPPLGRAAYRLPFRQDASALFHRLRCYQRMAGQRVHPVAPVLLVARLEGFQISPHLGDGLSR
jgi:hypothetical protein